MRIMLRMLAIPMLAFFLTTCSWKQQSELPEAAHEVGIAYLNLETGESLVYNANTIFHAASTMKIPVMFELFKMRDEGILNLDTKIPVLNEFTSIVDASLFRLPIKSSKDDVLFTSINHYLSYRELIEKMIINSSNLATNVLMEQTGADSISKTMNEISANGVLVVRGVEDLKAYRVGLNNVTSAFGMMKVLEAVYQSDLVADSSKLEMIEILKRQEYNAMIPAGLPQGVKVAHKTGSITGITHDAALVFPQDAPPFVLVILTRGWTDHAAARRVGARIAGKVYDYHRGLLKRTDIVVPELLE